MKRGFHEIEGDVWRIKNNSLSGVRHRLIDNDTPKEQSDTYFAWLPVEVISIVATYVIKGQATDYQAFVRYILPVFGISLIKHHKSHTEIQTTLLGHLQRILVSQRNALFKECLHERLARIRDCVQTTSMFIVKSEEQLLSAQAISNAPFVELYTLINYNLCECCKDTLAIERRHHLSFNLCQECGVHMRFDERVKDTAKIFDYREQACVYCVISDKKLRQWSDIKKGDPLLAALKSYRPLGSERDFYLMKDVLPYIKDKFINYAK